MRSVDNLSPFRRSRANIGPCQSTRSARAIRHSWRSSSWTLPLAKCRIPSKIRTKVRCQPSGGRAAYEAVPRELKSCRKSGARRLHVKPPLRGGGRMTAEIAIINKSAVALAADSAVTISSGTKREKIFNTEDKLFELCNTVPIGIMIYNGMSFAGTPIQVLLRRFRATNDGFDTVEDAAKQFLQYLLEFGRASPRLVLDTNVRIIIHPVFSKINEKIKDLLERSLAERIQQRAAEAGQSADSSQWIGALIASMYDEVIDEYLETIETLKDATFLGGPPKIDDKIAEIITDLANKLVTGVRVEHIAKLRRLGESILRKEIMSDSITGIVVAGFGKTELFPTLISFEIDGMVGGSLKLVRTNFIDIDRGEKKDAADGTKRRATVIPFAQKEMVERFLYGLDEKMQDDIAKFCESTIPAIGKKLLERLQFENNDDLSELSDILKKAQDVFLVGLTQDGFGTLRNRSRAQIEDMVEFMPKPELAEMAEALVNLTSIKRRVSRGMETVGGPIDVAIISQSEGFVWIKRKHYFPADRNPRYFERIAARFRHPEAQDAKNEQPRRPRSARSGSSKGTAAANRERPKGGRKPNK